MTPSLPRAFGRFAFFSTLAAVTLLATSGGTGTDVAPGVYVAVVAAVAVLEALRWLRLSTGGDVPTVAPLLARRPPRRAERPLTLLSVESLVDSARTNGRAARVRMQPRLQAVARHRLARSRGIDLDAAPAAARAAVGEAAWVTIGPATGPVPGPDEPGFSLASIDAAVDALERL